jgi:predicted adenine nucleotide alpha hydrolase (AANH) superfamily ATPase
MNTLFHICCAPCSISCLESLREEGIRPTGFWFNPNIHPVTEYKSRKLALEEYAKSTNLPMLWADDYGLRPFLSGLNGKFDDRCGFCYEIRLMETAKKAAEEGFDSFSTSLLVSPYQNHELLQKTGEEMAQKYGVSFLYRDFRPQFREGQNKARELGLYMQKYCGCIFSEEERYLKKKR